MIRLLLKLGLILIAIFASFSVTARALGTAQLPNPALAGFTEGCEDKPQPCWYGIVPGVTTIDEMLDTLSLHGYDTPEKIPSSQPLLDDLLIKSPEQQFYDVEILYDKDRRVFYFELSPQHQEIKLGDVIAILGNPITIRFRDRVVETEILAYSGTSIRASWTSPFNQVSLLHVNRSYDTTSQYIWLGFMPRWRYCTIIFSRRRC
jgi:hypothetical protein